MKERMIRWIAAAVLALVLAPACLAQTYRDSNGTAVPGVVPLVGCSPLGPCGGPISNANPLPVTGTFSASLAGFSPSGSNASLSASDAASHNVALPTGTDFRVENKDSNPVYCVPGTSSGVTATNASGFIAASSTRGLHGLYGSTPYSYLACISPTSSLSVTIEGGAGIVADSGGGGGGSGAGVPTGAAGTPNANVLTVQGITNGTPQSVAPPADAAASPQTISAADAASSSATWANGQTAWTGTPTANSAASFSAPSAQGLTVQATIGSGTATLATEGSIDGGTTWFSTGAFQRGGASPNSGASFTASFAGFVDTAGLTNFRVRATACSSCSVTVLVSSTINVHLLHATTLDPASGTHILSAASTNSTSIKGSAGTLLAVSWLQTAPTLMDIRFYDTASAPTCSSATGVKFNFVAQANTVSAGATIQLPSGGVAFSNGIGVCITGGNSDSDNSNAATGLNLNVVFK